jgi:hypothetical protein
MRNLVCRSKTNLNLCLETKFYVEYLYVRDMKERGIGDWAVTRWKASEFVIRIICYTDPSGCAVCIVGLWPLRFWNRGFESRSGHGCVSLVFI